MLQLSFPWLILVTAPCSPKVYKTSRIGVAEQQNQSECFRECYFSRKTIRIMVKKLVSICASVCIQFYSVQTLFTNLPNRLVYSLLIVKFIVYCTRNAIGIELSNGLLDRKLKHLYTDLYLSAQCTHISVKHVCFLLLIHHTKSLSNDINCISFVNNDVRNNHFKFRFKRIKSIYLSNEVCLNKLFNYHLTQKIWVTKRVYCKIDLAKILTLKTMKLSDFEKNILCCLWN